MLSATQLYLDLLLQESSELQVPPWLSVTACGSLVPPASGSPVDVGQTHSKRKSVWERQRGLLVLLCKASVFLLPLLLLYVYDVGVLAFVGFHTQLVFIRVTS